MTTTPTGWFFWAILSACFAALTAVFAKVGIKGIDSDFVTLIRTVIIVFVLGTFVWYAGKWSDPRSLSSKTLLFLSLSALATGASWIFYFRALQVGEASKVAPVDKFSLVLVAVFAFVFLGELPSVREWLGICLVASGVLLLALKRWRKYALPPDATQYGNVTTTIVNQPRALQLDCCIRDTLATHLTPPLRTAER
jgi:transporter family protein